MKWLLAVVALCAIGVALLWWEDVHYRDSRRERQDKAYEGWQAKWTEGV